jgi:hypothetical protein
MGIEIYPLLKLFIMSRLLEELFVTSGTIGVTSITETASVEVSGKFIMQRGNFKQEYSYWARTYEKLDNHAKIDDYEYEIQSTTIGDLPIDNVCKLINSLKESGLDTIASHIGFNDDEVAKAIYIHIQNHKIFKVVYGKKVMLWDLLNENERHIESTKFAIKHFDTCPEFIKRDCGFVGKDDEGNTIQHYTPTLEELKSRLEELTK